MNDQSFFETAKAIVSPVQTDAQAKLRQAAARVDDAYENLIREHYRGDYYYVEAAYEDARAFTDATEEAIGKIAEGLIDLVAHFDAEVNTTIATPHDVAHSIADALESLIATRYTEFQQTHWEYVGWAGASLRYAVAKRLADAEKLRRAFEQKLDKALSEAGE